MTQEDLKKYIDGMEIYIPIRLIERNLCIPKTTLQQVLKGNRKLPKKWVKVLEKYFNEKLYLKKENIILKNDIDCQFINAARGRDESGINEDELIKLNKTHPLYRKGDPKENTTSFFMKYDCYNYKELELKLKK